MLQDTRHGAESHGNHRHTHMYKSTARFKSVLSLLHQSADCVGNVQCPGCGDVTRGSDVDNRGSPYRDGLQHVQTVTESQRRELLIQL